MKNRGFILIIVLGLLGVLAAIGIGLAMRSRTSHELGVQGRLLAQARLLARSGVEQSMLKGIPTTMSEFWDLAGQSSILTTGYLPDQSPEFRANYRAELSDGSGRININDGIAAGKGELGAAYRADAIDPWPVLGKVTPDESGWINLRIRRLLNAYGDAHKYVHDIGLPPWQSPDPNYATAFNATCTAVGDRFVPDTGTLTGLGDRIISARPNAGYQTLDEIKAIVNAWGGSNLSDPDFFSKAELDLTVASHEDDDFFRFNLEFPQWTDNVNDSGIEMQFLDSSPPDLGRPDLWIRHPVALINVNGASTLVKAAVFGSMAQVEYMCEGMVLDELSGFTASHSPRDSIGRGGPVFGLGLVLENGVDVLSTPDRKNLFMSMYDALVLAQAMDDHINVNGPIKDWVAFEQALVDVRSLKQPYERAVVGAAASHPIITVPGGVQFDQTYVEKTLPKVLSTVRCLPGWLGAPLATLRPYIQEGQPSSVPDREFALRSVEDFVYRCHLPKVGFLPGGIQRISSVGEFGPTGSPASSRIRLTLRSFENRSLSSQSEFASHTDSAASSTSIAIGPEPSGVAPDEFMGVLGLKDVEVATRNSRPHSIAMNFDGNLTDAALGTNNYPPANCKLDPFVYDGNLPGAPVPMASGCVAGPVVPSDKTHYEASEMEGETASIYAWGPSGTNLSPFGGLLFSAIGHGPRGETPFSDSLYWRPETILGVPAPGTTTLAAQPGVTFNRGTVNFWWRNPSGYRNHLANRQLMQLRIWQYERSFHNSPSVKNVNRPYELILRYVGGRVQFKHSNANPGISEAPGGQRAVYGRELGLPLLGIPFSNPPSPNPPGAPGSNSGIMSPFRMSRFWKVPPPPYPPGSLPLPVKVNESGPHNIAQRHSLKHWRIDSNPANMSIYVSASSNHVNSVSSATGTQFQADRPPGSWNRFTASWNLRSYSGDYDSHYYLADMTRQGSPILSPPPVAPAPGGGITHSNVDHMILTFGEQLTGFTTSLFSLDPLGSGNAPSLSGIEPDYVPLYRFNSLIDNIDVRFGHTGGINNNSSGSNTPRRFFDNYAPTKTKRYSITLQSEGTTPPVEPRWVINPSIPDGDRVLFLGARIFDVPAVTSGHNSPWIELTAQDPGQIFSVLDASDPGTAEPYKSRSWVMHDSLVGSSDLRFILTYKAQDPDGNLFLQNYLCDIPWIKGVSWVQAPAEPQVVRMAYE